MISVLYDPVMRVIDHDGRRKTVGLMEALVSAHQIADIDARTPTGKCALTRLLIAILLDAYQPQSSRDRKRIVEQGAFDEQLLARYVELCERDGPRFLLDDAEHPFMQAPYDERLDAKAEKPVAALIADIPSGNSHVHLDHRGQYEHEADVPTALEALLETYLFCPAGLAGPSNVNNTPPLYALIRGDNLFMTLALNMISQSEIANIPLGCGQVPWRMDEQVVPRASVTQISLLRAFTWRPRRACLIFDKDGLIRRVFLQPGLDFRGDGRWMDPQVLFRWKQKDEAYATLKPELGRQLWRDAGMLAFSKAQKSRSTVPLMNIENVWEDHPAVIIVEVIGLITNQATCLGWVQEELCLPQCLIEDAEAAEEFRACLRMTESMNRVLTSAVQKGFKNQAALQAGEVFLQAMHDVVFGECLNAIVSNDTDPYKRMAAFADRMREALNEALSAVVEHCGERVEDMKRQNEARRYVMGSYWKMRKEEHLDECG